MAKSMSQYLQEGNRMKVGTGSFFLLYTVETEQIESSHICVFANVTVRLYLVWISLANLYHKWCYNVEHIKQTFQERGGGC